MFIVNTPFVTSILLNDSNYHQLVVNFYEILFPNRKRRSNHMSKIEVHFDFIRHIDCVDKSSIPLSLGLQRKNHAKRGFDVSLYLYCLTEKAHSLSRSSNHVLIDRHFIFYSFLNTKTSYKCDDNENRLGRFIDPIRSMYVYSDIIE